MGADTSPTASTPKSAAAAADGSCGNSIASNSSAASAASSTSLPTSHRRDGSVSVSPPSPRPPPPDSGAPPIPEAARPPSTPPQQAREPPRQPLARSSSSTVTATAANVLGVGAGAGSTAAANEAVAPLPAPPAFSPPRPTTGSGRTHATADNSPGAFAGTAGGARKPPRLASLKASPSSADSSGSTTPSRVVRHLSVTSSASDARVPRRLQHSARAASGLSPSDTTADGILAQVSAAMQNVAVLKTELAAKESSLHQQWAELKKSRDHFHRQTASHDQRLQQLRTHNSVLQRRCDKYRAQLATANRDLAASRRAARSFDMTAADPLDIPAAHRRSLSEVFGLPDGAHSPGSMSDLDMGPSSPVLAVPPTSAPIAMRQRQAPRPTYGSGVDAFPGTTPDAAAVPTEWQTPAKVAPASTSSRSTHARARRMRRHAGDDVDEIMAQYTLAKHHNERLTRELNAVRAVCAQQARELTRNRLARRSPRVTGSLNSSPPDKLRGLPPRDIPSFSRPGQAADVDAHQSLPLSNDLRSRFFGAVPSERQEQNVQRSESLAPAVGLGAEYHLLPGDEDDDGGGGGKGNRCCVIC